MEKILLFQEIVLEGSFHLFGVREGGNGDSIIVEHNAILPEAQQEFGTVHHAAF